MEWKLNPRFDTELSALTDIRKKGEEEGRDPFVRRENRRHVRDIPREKLSPIFFFHDRSIDRSLSIKDPRESVISFVSKFGKKVAVRSLVEKSNFNLIPRD